GPRTRPTNAPLPPATTMLSPPPPPPLAPRRPDTTPPITTEPALWARGLRDTSGSPPPCRWIDHTWRRTRRRRAPTTTHTMAHMPRAGDRRHPSTPSREAIRTAPRPRATHTIIPPATPPLNSPVTSRPCRRRPRRPPTPPPPRVRRRE